MWKNTKKKISTERKKKIKVTVTAMRCPFSLSIYLLCSMHTCGAEWISIYSSNSRKCGEKKNEEKNAEWTGMNGFIVLVTNAALHKCRCSVFAAARQTLNGFFFVPAPPNTKCYRLRAQIELKTNLIWNVQLIYNVFTPRQPNCEHVILINRSNRTSLIGQPKNTLKSSISAIAIRQIPQVTVRSVDKDCVRATGDQSIFIAPINHVSKNNWII